jgi:hypothetical protein
MKRILTVVGAAAIIVQLVPGPGFAKEFLTFAKDQNKTSPAMVLLPGAITGIGSHGPVGYWLPPQYSFHSNPPETTDFLPGDVPADTLGRVKMKNAAWIPSEIDGVDDFCMAAGLYATDILNSNSMDVAKFGFAHNCPGHERCNPRCLTVTCGMVGLVQSAVNSRYQKNTACDFQIDRSVLSANYLDN